MSDIIQQPKPSPLLAEFLPAMVGKLAEMHTEQVAHGNLEHDLNEWLDESTKKFDPIKFEETAAKNHEAVVAPNETNLVEGMTANSKVIQIATTDGDIDDFIKKAKFWITNKPESETVNFKAEFNQGHNLPISFLKLLETPQENDPKPSMADFSKTFSENASTEIQTAPEPKPEAETETPEPAQAPAPEPPAPTPPQMRIALRNGTVGKPYEIEPGTIAEKIASQRHGDPKRARISHLQLPDDCGLKFDETTGAVTGTPTRALEENLHLDYTASSSSASIQFEVSLLINPDPSSLWKDLDPAADAPYQKPSLDHKEYNFPDFRVVAASRRGRSHANKGDFRDDDFAVGFAETSGWLVIVVADGAGSAKYSRKGSNIAVTTCRDWLVGSLNTPEYQNIGTSMPSQKEGKKNVVRPIRDLLYDAARLAHDKIDKEAKNPSETLPEPATLRNYDTTLILLLMKKIGDTCLVSTFSIGDGGAGIFAGSDHATPLTHADGGEHAGQTTFLTIPSTLSLNPENLEKRFHVEVVKGFSGALSMTDGITDPKFPSDAAFADPACWKALWDELEPALKNSESLLEWMNFFSAGNHDDRTLVAILPPATPIPE